MLHALSSLYLEGLIPPGPFITAYPGHKPGGQDEVLAEWLRPAAKLFHGWFKGDIFIRASESPDTSRLRASGRQATPEMQMSTVHLNPAYQKKLKGKTVILVDDFTTMGTSLEWGRNLLLAAGAKRVVLVTIGKYGRLPPIRHTVYALKPGVKVDPFSVTTMSASQMFNVESLPLATDDNAAERTMHSLRLIKENRPFP